MALTSVKLFLLLYIKDQSMMDKKHLGIAVVVVVVVAFIERFFARSWT